MNAVVTLVLIVTSALGVAPSAGPDERPSGLIAGITSEIQGKRPPEVRAILVRRFGPPDRVVGSGLQIEQWDVDGGVLTFHPLVGPTYEKGGVRTRLMRTTNLAGQCLFGTYEMTTLPEGPSGMKYWLGNVDLADDHYVYRDSGQNRDHRAKETHNFFLLHPVGSSRVVYVEGLAPASRLEELRDGSPVALVTFTSRDREATQTFRIVAYPTSMTLVFESDRAIPFEMYRGWVNYWR